MTTYNIFHDIDGSEVTVSANTNVVRISYNNEETNTRNPRTGIHSPTLISLNVEQAVLLKIALEQFINSQPQYEEPDMYSYPEDKEQWFTTPWWH